MSRGSAVRLALLALLWGSGFLWIELALRGFTPVQIVLIRLTLGALVLAPVSDIASWGGLAILAASISYDIWYVYMGRSLANRGTSAIMLSAAQLAAGAMLMLPALPLGGLTAPTGAPTRSARCSSCPWPAQALRTCSTIGSSTTRGGPSHR